MFNENVHEMSMSELVKYITKNFHVPLRQTLKNLEAPVDLIDKEYAQKYSELSYLKELYSQFKKVILKHITKEDFIVFPAVIEYEKISNDNLIDLSDDVEIMEKLVNDVKMQNDHYEFDSYLKQIVDLLEWSSLNWKKVKEFDKLKAHFIYLQERNVIHSKLENLDLYSKWLKLQDNLKKKIKELK